MFGNLNRLVLMGIRFSYLKRLRFNLLSKFFQLFLLATFGLANTKLSYASPQTPSQALPKMFQKPPGIDYYQFKKQETVVPQMPQIDINQQEDTGIKINLKSLIILAPKELQNIVDKEKYYKSLIGTPQSINDLYQIAYEIERDFNEKGYPLVRVILPIQELAPEQATVFFKVIDGFIEKVDLSKVPKAQTLRTYAYLKPLINKKSLTLKVLERQLLLASNTAGLSLTSSLIPGVKEGSTRLVIEAEHKLLSGGISFDNSQSEQLGRQQGQASTNISSALGLGETISLFGLARPTIKGMSGTGHDVPIRAGGFSVSVPIGNKGLTTGLSYLESMTRPGGEVQSLGLEANMKSAQVTASYPIIYSRNSALFSRATLSWTDELQQTNAGGVDEDLSHDRITTARLGFSYNSCATGCLGIDAEISKGLDIASRSNSEVGEGTPLSKSTATSTFTHFNLHGRYSLSPHENILFKVNGGGQYTLNDLVNSEQKGITGEEKLSAFSSGAISGEEVWFVRGQLNFNNKLSKDLTISPYIYGAGGVAYINQPTATERAATAAKSMGLGLEINGGDEYFFYKRISGKIELSKNWATSNVEDVSDVRLNKKHFLVSLSMRF
jgi:hemolysin activation/secretion protein